MPRPSATADIFTAVADPHRRDMLVYLAVRERAVSDIVGTMQLLQPSVSKHLRVLREAGLVDTRREGRQVFYRTNIHAMQPFQDWAEIFQRFWRHQLGRVKERAERSADGKGGKL